MYTSSQNLSPHMNVMGFLPIQPIERSMTLSGAEHKGINQ